jgi:Protein kinase domain
VQTAVKSPHDWKRAAREIRILKRLKNHPAIIHLYDVISLPEEIHLVQELAQGGSLLDYVRERKTISEEAALRFFLQVVAGLEFCHSREVRAAPCLAAAITFNTGEGVRSPLHARWLNVCYVSLSSQCMHVLLVSACAPESGGRRCRSRTATSSSRTCSWTST